MSAVRCALCAVRSTPSARRDWPVQLRALDTCVRWYGTLAPPKDVVLFEGLDPKRGHVFHTVSLVAALSERVVAWVLKMA